MEDEHLSPRKLALFGAIFEGGLGLVAILIGWPLGIWPQMFIKVTPADTLWGIAAAGPMMVLLLVSVWSPIWPFKDIARVVDEILTPMFRRCHLWELALISACAGVGEEMLFRGLIQEAVSGWIGQPIGVWVGLAVAALLFGLVHPITPGYAILATLMGLYLGWLWIVSGNLLVPILAHGIYDFLALIYLVRIRRPNGPLKAPHEPIC